MRFAGRFEALVAEAAEECGHRERIKHHAEGET
jgi:hypothetical protein